MVWREEFKNVLNSRLNFKPFYRSSIVKSFQIHFHFPQSCFWFLDFLNYVDIETTLPCLGAILFHLASFIWSDFKRQQQQPKKRRFFSGSSDWPTVQPLKTVLLLLATHLAGPLWGDWHCRPRGGLFRWVSVVVAAGHLAGHRRPPDHPAVNLRCGRRLTSSSTLPSMGRRWRRRRSTRRRSLPRPIVLVWWRRPKKREKIA